MMNQMEKFKPKQIARSLSVLAKLIKKEREMAISDSRTHWSAIALLLVESFVHFNGQWEEFKSWFNGEEFDFGFDAAKDRMLALSNIQKNAHAFSPRPTLVEARSGSGYRMPADEIREAVRKSVEYSRRVLAQAAVQRDESAAIRKLAIQIVDIGFKTLSTKLHPDRRGGSHEAMRRLNAARALLKNAI